MKLIDSSEVPEEVGLASQSVVFRNTITVEPRGTDTHKILEKLHQITNKYGHFEHACSKAVSLSQPLHL